MATIQSMIYQLFGNNNNSNKNKNKSNKNNKRSKKLITTQPKITKSLNPRQSTQYGLQLSKLVDNHSKNISEENKVVLIIENLKRHPEKEDEIMAKYGALLKKHKGFIKNMDEPKKASGRKRNKSKSKK